MVWINPKAAAVAALPLVTACSHGGFPGGKGSLSLFNGKAAEPLEYGLTLAQHRNLADCFGAVDRNRFVARAGDLDDGPKTFVVKDGIAVAAATPLTWVSPAIGGYETVGAGYGAVGQNDPKFYNGESVAISFAPTLHPEWVRVTLSDQGPNSVGTTLQALINYEKGGAVSTEWTIGPENITTDGSVALQIGANDNDAVKSVVITTPAGSGPSFSLAKVETADIRDGICGGGEDHDRHTAQPPTDEPGYDPPTVEPDPPTEEPDPPTDEPGYDPPTEEPGDHHGGGHHDGEDHGHGGDDHGHDGGHDRGEGHDRGHDGGHDRGEGHDRGHDGGHDRGEGHDRGHDGPSAGIF